MLAVSPLRNSQNNGSEMEGFLIEGNEFSDFSIDFDDLFVGINELPDLDFDPEIYGEFSGGDESEMNMLSVSFDKFEEENNFSASGSDLGSGSSSLIQGEEIVSKRDAVNPSSTAKQADRSSKGRKSSKNPLGKRKVKVDWTPELHRRFVQAVEQLGVDKAVPSRILELMGIDCLTRHNIASHLQKYRSHRKHLLAREAEAASWTQRRQMYNTVPPPGGGGMGKRDVNPWIAPTMGFPPAAPMPHFRPLHVWGHPSVDQSLMHMWPKHLAPSPHQPPHAWPSAPPPHHPHVSPADPSFWHPHQQHHINVPSQGTPCYPPHVPPPTRFPIPPVSGAPPPPPPMYPTVPAGQTSPHQPPSDVHPSKESIDAAIGDVLSKPWLPLPLGLKPPSMDSVMVELQSQGISKIPPTCA